MIVNALLQRLGFSLPVIQAPMAGVSTPAMAAAVSNAGALGSIGIGNLDAAKARTMISSVRASTDRPFNVNVFCHRPALADPTKQSAWLARLAPLFSKYDAQPPQQLNEIYKSFLGDDEMLQMLLQERPAVVSFHFGLPSVERIRALQNAGIVLFATATTLREARAIEAAGVDAVVAQGYEAGGHRGLFDPAGSDDKLSTIALTRILVRELQIPVIAAGGIMDGAGIASALLLGANAAQLGTAFIDCAESSADAGYRALLRSEAAQHTTMTSVISGRPARCLANDFTAFPAAPAEIPAYPIAYDAAKALHAVATAAHDTRYGPHWAGQGAPLARSMPAAELVAVLHAEMKAALAGAAHLS